MTEEVDVVVVGAGLAGLCCARELSSAGLAVALLERSDGVGGRVRTDEVDGYLIDRGFQILLTAYPEVAGQLDVDALDLQSFDPGSLIWNGSSLDKVSDPLRRPGDIVSTLRSDVGSIGDKIRIGIQRQKLVLADAPDLLRRKDRTTAASLKASGFSEKIIKRFFRPLLGGILLDPSLETSARMFEIIFRTLAVGDAAIPEHGMQRIPEQLAADLPTGTVRLNSTVEKVDGHTVHVQGGESITGRAVVVATEGPTAASLTSLPDPGSKQVSALWFSTDEPPVEGRSIVLDGTSQGPVLNMAVMSQVASSYAPAGKHLIVAACPGRTTVGLEAEVRSQLSGWFGDAVSKWEVVHANDIAHGQPMAAVPFSPKQSVSLGDGLFVTGDHRDTPSIQGAMYSGRRCGEAVVASLASA